MKQLHRAASNHYPPPSVSYFLAWCAALLLLPLIVLLWATESPSARVRRWQAAGLSQQTMADRLGVTRYRVRQLLTVGA